MGEILKMRRRYNTTSVVVTHDLEAAARISDRAAMIHDGRIIARGAISELETSSDPDVRTFFTIMNSRDSAAGAEQGRHPDADA